MKPVRYSNRAEEDIVRAVTWYESIQPGLGLTLLDLVEDLIEQIAESPQLYQVRYRTFRAGVLPRYPYSVFYTDEPDEIVIHAVFDDRQSPNRRP